MEEWGVGMWHWSMGWGQSSPTGVGRGRLCPTGNQHHTWGVVVTLLDAGIQPSSPSVYS